MSYESAIIMYKTLNITKSFDIETFISDLPELVVPNKTIPKMTNKEIFHHPSKRVINEETGNSENLHINLKNCFQYLSDMGDDLEDDITDDIDDIHPIGGARRKSYSNAVKGKGKKIKYMQDLQLSQINLIVLIILILIFWNLIMK